MLLQANKAAKWLTVHANIYRHFCGNQNQILQTISVHDCGGINRIHVFIPNPNQLFFVP